MWCPHGRPRLATSWEALGDRFVVSVYPYVDGESQSFGHIARGTIASRFSSSSPWFTPPRSRYAAWRSTTIS